MVFNLKAKFFMVALTVSSTLLLTSELGLSQTQGAPKTDATTFQCVRQGSGYATIAQRGNRRTSPIITWNSTAFGPQYTPQKRCEAVSQRLTQAVASSGGRLSKLRITNGTLNSTPVICYITNKEEQCNSKNLLLTLNQSDRGKEEEILKQLMAFSVSGTTAPLTRGTDNRTIIGIGDVVEKALETDGATVSPTSTLPVSEQSQPALPKPSTLPKSDNSI
ncbi:MAG: COP23 domain-containing protein [Scytonema hyalinum WJT4-NPBG1]|jgi:hypothetical protein|nr:COP23 domain-containing protein [Scytonema hyalinum WJT4-NPBG1]